MCAECGAKLAAEAERCDLCGSPVAAGVDPQPSSRSTSSASSTSSDAQDAVCNQCGWKNPPGARFCSQCGSALQVPSAGRTKAPSMPPAGSGNPEPGGADSSISRHVALVIGLAVLVVVALYLVTVVSKQRIPAEASASTEAPADVRSASVIDAHEAIPVDPNFAPVADSLSRVAGDTEGEGSLEARRKLSDYLLEVGRVDRAAIEQRRVATDSGTLADWSRAADLFFDWMELTEGEEKTDIALLTIDALKNVLEKDPENIDARAKLGWAYQFDPSHPMEAIQQTNKALEQDPDHLMANYNRAVFLTRINRLDEATAQFERVKGLSEEGSLYFRRAEAWLESIRSSRTQDGG